MSGGLIERLRAGCGNYATVFEAADLIATLQAEKAELVAENEKLRAAISWIEPPFVTEETDADELRNRISFCVADAKRARTTLARTEGQG